MSKWKEIETYTESKSVNEGKFNINRKQAQMILDLKSDELKKMKFLAMLDIDKDELKILAKQDPSIIKAIGKQGGSFRTSMVRKRANEENELKEARYELEFSPGDFDEMSADDFADEIQDELKGDYKIRAKISNYGRKAMGLTFDTNVPKAKMIKVLQDEMGYVVEGVEIQEQFSTGMIDKLRKAYGPLKGKRINPTPLMKTFDKIDKNKDALIQLYKADIPFVSQLAVSRLISKHNMKGKDINKLRDKYGVTTGYSKLTTDTTTEDAPTNSVASGGVDMNPTGLSKKKRDLDGRTKEYKIHASKLTAQREKRMKKKEMIKGSFVKEVTESMCKFAREEFIVEDNVGTLRNIVKRNQAMPLKFKDGTMKIDLTTASGLVKNILDGKMKPETLKKITTIINQGKKSQFLQLVDMMYKGSR